MYIQWVKAHCGIHGNEIADRTANLSHKANKSVLLDLNKLEDFSQLKEVYKKVQLEKWKEQCELTRKGLYRKNLQTEIKSSPWLYNKNRRLEIVIARLRMGHVEVNQHLHRFKRSLSPKCSTCNVDEDVVHFVMQCPAFQPQRRQMMKELADIGMLGPTLSDLLGCGSHNSCKQNKIIRALTKCLLSTGKLCTL